MNIKLAHTENAPASENAKQQELNSCSWEKLQRNLAGCTLLRLDAKTEDHSGQQVCLKQFELLRSPSRLTHVLVDNRANDPALTLAVPKIAALKFVEKLDGVWQVKNVSTTGSGVSTESMPQLIRSTLLPKFRSQSALAIETTGQQIELTALTMASAAVQNIDKVVRYDYSIARATSAPLYGSFRV